MKYIDVSETVLEWSEFCFTEKVRLGSFKKNFSSDIANTKCSVFQMPISRYLKPFTKYLRLSLVSM